MHTLCIELDLKRPHDSIFVDARYDRLSVLARWGFRPLGLVSLEIPAGSRTIPGSELINQALKPLGSALWERILAGDLDEINRQDGGSFPPVSVIVCTRDRALSLEGCLASLQNLDYPAYEVLVVDNGSKDPAVPRVVAASGFRYTREARPGLDWARNRGFQEARFDLVAYTDDDARVDSGWLRGLASAFADPQVMAVTGLVLPAEIETPSQQDFEDYGGMSKGFSGRTISIAGFPGRELFWASNWGVGANMAFRRELFDRIGGFDVALDVGTPAGGGGDIEFFYRLVAGGYTLRYEPSALVRHIHRRDRVSFRRQIYSNGRSFPAYLLAIARRDPHRRLQVMNFALRDWLWGWVLKRLLKNLILRNWRDFNAALPELWGAISGLPAYWRSQRMARQLSASSSSGRPDRAERTS